MAFVNHIAVKIGKKTTLNLAPEDEEMKVKDIKYVNGVLHIELSNEEISFGVIFTQDETNQILEAIEYSS